MMIIIIIAVIISLGFQVIMMIISFGFQVIAAEGEHKASRALRHAAEVIADSPAALQVTSRITESEKAKTFWTARFLLQKLSG